MDHAVGLEAQRPPAGNEGADYAEQHAAGHAEDGRRPDEGVWRPIEGHAKRGEIEAKRPRADENEQETEADAEQTAHAGKKHGLHERETDDLSRPRPHGAQHANLPIALLHDGREQQRHDEQQSQNEETRKGGDAPKQRPERLPRRGEHRVAGDDLDARDLTNGEARLLRRGAGGELNEIGGDASRREIRQTFRRAMMLMAPTLPRLSCWARQAHLSRRRDQLVETGESDELRFIDRADAGMAQTAGDGERAAADRQRVSELLGAARADEQANGSGEVFCPSGSQDSTVKSRAGS